jgi:hypothetical protein
MHKSNVTEYCKFYGSYIRNNSDWIINMEYILPKTIKYYSPRYKKWITVPEGYASDGATGAIDIYSRSWWIHDKLCDTGKFDDGTPCTNWQASKVLSDVLAEEGHWLRAQYWFTFTWLFGGGEARENGMW